MRSIPFQSEFRPTLPLVFGNRDYCAAREVLEQIDRILVSSGLEDDFVHQYLTNQATTVSQRKKDFTASIARKALRHSLLLALSGLSVRELAIRIPDSHLFAWFTASAQIDGIRCASKSTIDRYEKMFTEAQISELIHELNRVATNPQSAQDVLAIREPLSIEAVYADTTCVKAYIHFPVDWVILRDAARTLIKSISLIRSQGLRNRMCPPEVLLRNMNKLCIQMTHTRHKKDSTRARKLILRLMKRLSHTISFHAKRHRALLLEHREKTRWSEAQAAQIISRLDNVLSQLPQAIKQAHERMIAERQVANADKIISLYEPDVHVIVRGKAGASVEFGNALYLAEQEQGLVVDWEFLRDQPPADSQFVEESITRIEGHYATPGAFAADRGFHSKKNSRYLESKGIFNAICPKPVAEHKARLKSEPRFSKLQTRRGSTEARIAILQNNYFGDPLRSKGFTNRHRRITWCILAHNLWKLALMAAAHQREAAQRLAA